MTFTERLYTNMGSPLNRPEQAWRDQAACKGADPSIFFPDVGVSPTSLLPEAREFCDRCPVTAECLAEGEDAAYGIWGGRVFGAKSPVDSSGQKWRWVECRNCGAPTKNYSGGHPRKWCSSRCRMQAEKARAS